MRFRERGRGAGAGRGDGVKKWARTMRGDSRMGGGGVGGVVLLVVS